MKMAESGQNRIGIMISRAPVPALCSIVGTQLYLSERPGSTRESMSMIAGSDEGIYKLSQLLPVFFIGRMDPSMPTG